MTDAKSIIPEIDISALFNVAAVAEQRETVLNQIHTACRDIGFMSVVGHNVSMKLIEKMEAASFQFFHLPADVKMKIAPNKWNADNDNKYRGYFPASVFCKEGLDMCDLSRTVSADPSCHLNEVNKFPEEFTDEQFQVFSEYFTALHTLGLVLVKSVFTIFGANVSQVDEMFRRPDLAATFRLNYYPQHKEEYDFAEVSAQDGVKLSCETHTDSVVFTILHQDEVGGLQVQTPKDLQWHNVPCNKAAFVINTGRALEHMTNGQYKATFHRVLLGNQERLSIPFFFEPVIDYILDSRVLLPDEAPKYQKMSYKDHILSKLTKFKEYQRE